MALVRFFYTVLWYILLPFILLRLFFWRAYRLPLYRKRWLERFGYSKVSPTGKTIWVHAVSLGEVIAAIPIIKEIRKRFPQQEVVITTMSFTGSEKITQDLSLPGIYHTYVPYDYPAALTRFIRRFKPYLLIILETELWPNMLFYCNKYKIKVVLANARMSNRSAKNYQKIAFLSKWMLGKISLIAAQGKEDAAKYIGLGAQPEKVLVMGNIKFDIDIPLDLFEQAKNMHDRLGAKRPVWIAASTHEGEDEIILNAHKLICKQLANALLILVPRHPERFKKVFELCVNSNFETVNFTAIDDSTNLPTSQIILGDTIGKLLFFYALADVAFVGGSMVPKGGHNLLEPAALKLPIVSGKYLFNFVEISRFLTEKHALEIADNDLDLATKVINLLTNENLRQKIGNLSFEVVADNKGAVNKLFSNIEKYLNHG